MHYYQFNIGDYVTSTQHLEPMEDLAYRRMLDLYYQKEQPLPLDKEKIARLIRMRSHCDCIAFVLSEYFIKEKDGYHNDRADKDLQVVYSKSDKAKRSAEARWAKSRKIKELEECERIANASTEQCERNANGMLPNTYYLLPNTEDLSLKDLMSEEKNSDSVFVIEHFNRICDTKYKKTTKSHIENINGRLSDGHSVEDLKMVIEYKFNEWKDQPSMAQYIRPQTLFSAGKFQGYLTAAKTKPATPKTSLHNLQDIDYGQSGKF